ncbi:MAG TPA: hypothetical protein VF271_10425 [Rhodanobacteraceae bacterium]
MNLPLPTSHPDAKASAPVRWRPGGWLVMMIVFAGMALLPFAIAALVLWRG